MRLTDKYLLGEFLMPLIYCLLAFCMVFVVYDLFDHLPEFLEVRTPLALIGIYYGCMLLSLADYLLPASLLLSILYALWRLTRSSELVAMRASGISLYRALLPFLVVGLVATVVSAGSRELLGPRAAQWAAEFAENDFELPKRRVRRNIPYMNSRDRRVWMIDEIDMNRPERLLGVTVSQERVDGSKAMEITAARAEWLDGRWWFFDGYLSHFHPTAAPKPPEHITALWAEFSELSETPSIFVNSIKPWSFLSIVEMDQYLRDHRRLSREERTRKKVDIHSRLAMPWTCFIVTLFGIPVGARTGRQSILSGVFAAMALLFAFYGVIQIGVILGKTQRVAPWLGAWLANIIFLGAGLDMVRRMR